MRFCCSDFREFDYFTDPFCYLSVDIVFLVLLRANHCAKMFVANNVDHNDNKSNNNNNNNNNNDDDDDDDNNNNDNNNNINNNNNRLI